MDAFDPLINILSVLTVLSVAAERVTNVVKLRKEDTWRAISERQREFNIQVTNVIFSLFIALAVKADIFSMFARPDAPWSTLGWVQWTGTAWAQSASVVGASAILHTFVGCIVTGIALGFGSKFWHDVLGIVFEARELTKKHKERVALTAPLSVGTAPGAVVAPISAGPMPANPGAPQPRAAASAGATQ
jgi:hypothetical protein